MPALSTLISIRAKATVEFYKVENLREDMDRMEETIDESTAAWYFDMLQVMKSFAKEDGSLLFLKTDLDFDEWKKSLTHCNPDLKNQILDKWDDFLDKLANYKFPTTSAAHCFIHEFVEDFLDNWEHEFRAMVEKNSSALEFVDPVLSAIEYLKNACYFQQRHMRGFIIQSRNELGHRFEDEISVIVKNIEQMQKDFPSYRFPASIKAVFNGREPELSTDPILRFYSDLLKNLEIAITSELKSTFEDRFIDDDEASFVPVCKQAHSDEEASEEEPEEQDPAAEIGTQEGPIVIDDDDDDDDEEK